MDQQSECDVVVMGAGLAGCTAAILYAREGLRVALVESHPDMDAYKRVCTHYVQASALPVLQRLGVEAQLEAAGAVHNVSRIWSPAGWIEDPELFIDDRPVHGYNIRRSVLDPMLRRLAEATSGVELALGHTVDEVLTQDGVVSGVITRTVDGARHRFVGRLVVAADGRTSKVAKLVRVSGKQQPHGRCVYFAYYRSVVLAKANTSHSWVRADGGVNYAFPNDDGLTVLAVMRPKAEVDGLRTDPGGALERSFSGLPDAPDQSAATREGQVLGVVNYPSITRAPTRPGLALVGDAGLVGDYLWGVGCGWALQSASWLVDATAEALRTGRDLDKGLTVYGRRRRQGLDPHQKLLADFATGRPMNALERLVFGSAPHDPVVADRFFAFATRSISPTHLLRPAFLLRMVLARRHGSRVVSSTVPSQRTSNEQARTDQEVELAPS